MCGVVGHPNTKLNTQARGEDGVDLVQDDRPRDARDLHRTTAPGTDDVSILLDPHY